MVHDDGDVSFSDLGRAGGAVMLAAWLGLGLNVVLAAAKVAAGLLAPSQAMLADGLHSAGDAAAALAVSIGIRVGRRPPDADHPHGHARAEEVAALIVGVVLAVAGLEIGLDSVAAVWSSGPTEPGRLALYVGGVAIVLKEGMYRYQSWLAAREGNPALAAAAAEHRTCALKTGITFLSVVGARWGLRWLDPAAGFVIGVFVMIMAARISRRAIDGLMGRVTTAGRAPGATGADAGGQPEVVDSSRAAAPQPPL